MCMLWCIFFLVLLYKYWFSELLTVDGSSAPRVVRVYKRQSIFSFFFFLLFSVTMHNLMSGNFSRRSERHLVFILSSLAERLQKNKNRNKKKKRKKKKQRMKMDVNLYFSRTVTVWLMRFRIYSHNAIRAVCSIIINCHWPCKTYRLLLPPRFEVFPLFSQHWFSLNAENRGESQQRRRFICSRLSVLANFLLAVVKLAGPRLLEPESWNVACKKLRWENCSASEAL